MRLPHKPLEQINASDFHSVLQTITTYLREIPSDGVVDIGTTVLTSVAISRTPSHSLVLYAPISDEQAVELGLELSYQETISWLVLKTGNTCGLQQRKFK